MKTLTTIRNELRDIRYYFSRKEVFDTAEYNVGKTLLQEKIEMYNNAIRLAPARLYDLYVSLYLQNNTIESLSEKLGYTYEHISRLNCQLVKFLQKNIVEKEEKADV